MLESYQTSFEFLEHLAREEPSSQWAVGHNSYPKFPEEKRYLLQIRFQLSEVTETTLAASYRCCCC